MLIQKSTEFNIDLNARDEDGKTAFHFACRYGRKDVVEMMVYNTDFFKIDLKAKDKHGKTGFQYAKEQRRNDIVDIIKQKLPNIDS